MRGRAGRNRLKQATVLLVGLLGAALGLSAAAAAPIGVQPVLPSSSDRGLIQNVSIIGPADDRRQATVEYCASVGLSAAQCRQLHIVTGQGVCPLGGNRFQVFSGGIVGAGDVFLTAGHAFFYQPAPGAPFRPVPDRGQCYFVNYANPSDRIPFSNVRGDLRTPLTAADIPGMTLAGMTRDVALVRLSRPVPGAEPLSLDLAGPNLAAGDPLIVVTRGATEADGFKPLPHPKMQIVAVRPIGAYKGRMLFLSDADSQHGDSGGLFLRAGAKGRLVVEGVLVSGGDESDRRMRNCSYREDVSQLCNTKAVEVGGKLLDEIRSFIGGSKAK